MALPDRQAHLHAGRPGLDPAGGETVQLVRRARRDRAGQHPREHDRAERCPGPQRRDGYARVPGVRGGEREMVGVYVSINDE